MAGRLGLTRSHQTPPQQGQNVLRFGIILKEQYRPVTPSLQSRQPA